MVVCAVLAGSADHCPQTYAAREYRLTYTPGEILYGGKSARRSSCRRRASVCASVELHARQRQARPGPLKVNFSLYDAEGARDGERDYCRTVPRGAGGGGAGHREGQLGRTRCCTKHDENYTPPEVKKAMVKPPPPRNALIRTPSS